MVLLHCFPFAVLSPNCVPLTLQFLCRDPSLRLGCREQGRLDVIQSPFFSTIDWTAVSDGMAPARWLPPPCGRRDVANFDETFTDLDIQLTPGETTAMLGENDPFEGFAFVNPYFS